MATFNSSQAAERASRPLTQRISTGRRSNSLSSAAASTRPASRARCTRATNSRKGRKFSGDCPLRAGMRRVASAVSMRAAMWASRAKGRWAQGASKSRHSARFQAALRISSSGSPLSRSARQASRARARDRAGEGAERRRSVQRRKTPAKTRRASGWASSWKTGSMRASTGRRRRSCAQKAWIVPMKARSRLRAASARRFWTAGLASRARRRSSSWRTRSFMLPAAACVKVTATMVSTGVPAAMTSTMRSTSAVVFPVPAEASTTQLRSRSETGAGVMVQPPSVAVAQETAPSRSRLGLVRSELRYSNPSHDREGVVSRCASTSFPPSHFLQPLQLRLRLFLHPLLFIRTAHGKVLAVLAAAFARRGGECPVDDGPIDRFQHVLRAPPRPIVQRHVDRGVILRDRGVVQAPHRHWLPQHLFGGQRVERGLQDFALAHRLRARIRNPPGLMIHHANHAASVALYQVDGALQSIPPADRDAVLAAARSGPGRILHAETQLAKLRRPIPFEPCLLWQPAAQVGT